MNHHQTINISTMTIVKILAVFLILTFLYLIKEIVAIIFMALILSAAVDPWVDWFQKFRFPRSLSLAILYVLLLAIVAGSIILIVPPISREVTSLAENFPLYYQKVADTLAGWQNQMNFTGGLQFQQGLANLSQNLSGTIGGLFSTLIDIFGGILSVILVLVLTFYFTIQEQAMKGFVKSISPSKWHPYLISLQGRIQKRLGYWLRGQVILSLIIFVFTFIGLTLLNVPYALVLALIAGALEIIPTLGPILAGIPAVFLALLQSPFLALMVVILFFVIHELENNLITPKVMSKAVGLNPVVVIIVVLIGAKLGGILGIIFSVPITTAISVFVEDFLNERVERETTLET